MVRRGEGEIRTEECGGEEDDDERPPDFERPVHVRLCVPEPEEADDDEEVEDLLRVALDVEDERVRDGRWGRDDHNHLRAVCACA